MIGEIIFDIFVFLHYNFKTTLPYKWDFCRLQLARNSKLVINSSSYFIVYAAFTYWFVQYVIRCLTNLSDCQFRGKDKFLAYALSISTGAKVFWPLFLLSTYFFTCTFYPWFTALVVIFLNYPSALTVLAPRGSGLQFSLQYFVEYVGIGSDSREEFSPAERTELHPPDASILGSTEIRPIRSRYSAGSTEDSYHQSVLRTSNTAVPGRERREMDTEVSSSDDYITGVRLLLRPSAASVSHGTEVPLVLSTSSEQYAKPSCMHLNQYLRTSSRIPSVAETELFSFTNSEDQTESSDIPLIRYPRTSSRIPGVSDAELFSCTSSESSDRQLRRQLKSREQEIIPPTSSRYYPIPSQQSRSGDEIQHVSKQRYRKCLAKQIKEYEEDNRWDSKYQETSQTLPKTVRGLRTSHIRQSHLTSDEDLEREKGSKRKLRTQGKVRDRSKEIEGIDVPVSTEAGSIFEDWRRRLGYCGHCGLHDNLPFRQDFSELRTPYRTRSGFIYGPIRRLLNLPDFLKYYIRR